MLENALFTIIIRERIRIIFLSLHLLPSKRTLNVTCPSYLTYERIYRAPQLNIDF